MLDAPILRYTGISRRIFKKMNKSDEWRGVAEQVASHWMIKNGVSSSSPTSIFRHDKAIKVHAKYRRRQYRALSKIISSHRHTTALLLVLNLSTEDIKMVDGAKMLTLWQRGVPAKMLALATKNEIDDEMLHAMVGEFEERRVPVAMRLMQRGLA